MPDLYPSLLGASWAELSPAVQRLHAGGAVARGTFRVRRGPSRFMRLLATLLGLPAESEQARIALRVERTRRGGERWIRTFPDRVFRSLQWRRGDLLVEAIGLVQCCFRLRADRGMLLLEQERAVFGLHNITLPLPRWLAPSAAGRSAPEGDHVQVDVRVELPLFGLLISYSGRVTPEDDS
jgi:hypothetical protein